jgi:site-specific DNA recombinase
VVVTRAVVYTRVSLDRAGDSTSPERQETLCRSLAEAREFEVVAVFSDRDRSAWRRGVKRPGWDAMKASVERHEVDVVLAYSLTRLGRRAGDLLDLVEFLQKYDTGLMVYDQNLDTTTPAGKLLYTVIAALAELESAQTSERVKSHHQLAAARGDMHAGGSRYSFGYNIDGSINKRAASAARKVTDRLLAGESLGRCAGWLNDRGVLTARGGLWTSQLLGQALRAPKIAGLRLHGDQVLPGNWEPVIPEEVWLRLVAKLDSRKTTGNGRGVPAHLLTGLAVCGRCGCNLRAAHFKQPNGKIFDRYGCQPQVGRPNCGSCAVSKKSIDQCVTDSVFDFLAATKLRPIGQGERTLAEIEADITEVETRLEKIAHDHYVSGILPETTFLKTHDELAQKITELRATRSATEANFAQRPTVLLPGNREDIEAWWEQASLAERRDALANVVSRIVVLPAAHRGGNKFDKSRIQIEWRWDAFERTAKAIPSFAPHVDLDRLKVDAKKYAEEYGTTEEMIEAVTESDKARLRKTLTHIPPEALAAGIEAAEHLANGEVPVAAPAKKTRKRRSS